LDKKLFSLEAKQPQKLGARQLYCKDLVELASTWKANGRPGTQDLHTKVFKKHAALWKRLPPEQKRKYAAQVDVAQACSQDLKEAAIEETLVKLRLLRSRHEQEEGYSLAPLRLSECKLLSSDLDAYQGFFNNSGLSTREVQAMREKAMTAAPLPSPEVQAALGKIPVWIPSSERHRPQWMSAVAKHRELFVGAAFVFREANERTIYKFMFAMQNPLHITFARLRQLETYIRVADVTHENLDEVALQTWRRTYDVDFVSFTCWDELPEVPFDNVTVCFNLQHVGGNQIYCDDEEQALQAFLDSYPHAAD
jgi:hypothetical protein